MSQWKSSLPGFSAEAALAETRGRAVHAGALLRQAHRQGASVVPAIAPERLPLACSRLQASCEQGYDASCMKYQSICF
jgi:hypothetical protein